jgi:hypothetical protein
MHNALAAQEALLWSVNQDPSSNRWTDQILHGSFGQWLRLLTVSPIFREELWLLLETEPL